MKKTGIITFAFGKPKTLEANKLIARLAIEYSKINNAPILLQKDIPIDNGNITHVTEFEDMPPPTYTIAKDAIPWIINNNLSKVIIIAAEPHIDRCVRDVEKLLIKNSLTTEVTCLTVENYHGWFDKKSTQKRTQSYGSWWFREFILMNMPFVLYEKISLRYLQKKQSANVS